MLKILIAEDDVKLLDVFYTTLESEEFCVIKAFNGGIAWEILQANPDIALLICDLAMPEFDGRELISYMKDDALLCKMPILVVSGVLRAREIDYLLKKGVSHFMAKPVNIQEFVDTVKRLIAVPHK